MPFKPTPRQYDGLLVWRRQSGHVKCSHVTFMIGEKIGSIWLIWIVERIHGFIVTWLLSMACTYSIIELTWETTFVNEKYGRVYFKISFFRCQFSTSGLNHLLNSRARLNTAWLIKNSFMKGQWSHIFNWKENISFHNQFWKNETESKRTRSKQIVKQTNK